MLVNELTDICKYVYRKSQKEVGLASTCLILTSK